MKNVTFTELVLTKGFNCPYDMASVLMCVASGEPKTSVAKAKERNTKTVLHAVRMNPDRMGLFTKTETGSYELSDKSKGLVCLGELVVFDIVITGDVADGIIHCEKVITDINHPCDDLTLSKNDIGVLSVLKVGKVFVKSKGSEFGTYMNKSQRKTYSETIKGVPDWSYGQYNLSPTLKNPEEVLKPALVIEVPQPEYIWNASSQFINITKGRETWNCDSTHENFKDAIICLASNDIEKAIDLINISKAIEKYVNGNIHIECGELLYKGLSLRTGLTKRIIDAMQEGDKGFEFFIPFLENLMENPSNKAVYRLYDFLNANDITITEDGHFLAFKKVGPDYMDLYKGEFNNAPGEKPEMPRNMVNEDDTVTCSNGLHVCSKSYLPYYASAAQNRVVLVKVHPRDVVAIPVDYNNAKMRCSTYEVIEDVTDQLDKF